MNNAIQQNLTKADYYLKLILKKRWLIIIPFCLAMIVGSVLTLKLPKIYSASNLILVVPKSVPDKYVPDVLATDVQQRINTIKQQIMSRTNLERIIESLNLFSDPKYRHMFFVDKIQHIRKNTSIKLTKSRQGIDSFTISYKGDEPETVMKIVNTLSDLFINESVKVIESEVLETNTFLSGELGNLRDRLEEIEKKINIFRKKFMGELPEELNSNLSTLSRLNEQLGAAHDGIRDAKSNMIAIDNRIAVERENMANQARIAAALYAARSQSGQPIPNNSDAPLSELDQLRLLLKQLEIQYTPNHPDVIRTKEAIAKLEIAGHLDNAIAEIGEVSETLKGEAMPNSPLKENKASTEKPPNSNASASLPFIEDNIAGKRAMVDLKIQREAVVREIKENELRIKQIEEEIKKYQQRVENTPKREQELMAMRRNYENLQRSYNNLLDRKLESDIAVNMERKQKGQKFRVIDTATLPQKPVSPNMKLIFVAMVGLGFGLGIGIIVLSDLIDVSVKSPEEIQKASGVPTLALIPVIYTERQKFMHKLNRIFSVLGGGLAFGLFLIFFALSFLGVDRIMGAFNNYIAPLIGLSTLG